MAKEREDRKGVPANTNPFCVVEDIAVASASKDDPGVREGYIIIDMDAAPYAPEKFKGSALSQKKAEDLVRRIYRADVLGASSMGGAIAVRSEYVHIIPVDMSEVPVVDKRYTLEGRCDYGNVY